MHLETDDRQITVDFASHSGHGKYNLQSRAARVINPPASLYTLVPCLFARERARARARARAGGGRVRGTHLVVVVVRGALPSPGEGLGRSSFLSSRRRRSA
eukprot:29902-Pelagococcus_subviridis.AAC.6